MTLIEKLTAAAKRPEQWDIPGLLKDAAELLADDATRFVAIRNLSRLAWTDPATIREAFEKIHKLAS